MIGKKQRIPEETLIYFPKWALALYWTAGIGLLIYGLYLNIDGKLYGTLFAIGSLTSLYYAIQKTSVKDPCLMLNAQGIKTYNTSFMKWEDVKRADTKWVRHGRSSICYLILEFTKADAHGNLGDKVNITELWKSPGKIDELIYVYQGRHRIRQ